MFLVLFILLNFIHNSVCNSIEVRTDAGHIRGFTEIINGREINVFLGIPYAEPPIDKLRFKKPQEFKGFGDDVYNANKWPNVCVQPEAKWLHPKASISEDCLYLNVWTPFNVKSKSELNQKAVMVYIHGGAFIYGSSSMSSLNGSTFSSYGDVVVVTINYRLGIFGFLYGGNDEVPGNMGLWDQVMALQWVNDNIHKFGGDRKKITIFGNSAGSMSVHFHLLSPISRQLFTNAIMMSGIAFEHFFLDTKEDAFKKANLISENVECEEENSDEEALSMTTIKCMRNLKASKFTAIKSLFPSPIFGDLLLPRSAFVSWMKGDFKRDSSLLIGTVVNDGSCVPMALPKNPKESLYVVFNVFQAEKTNLKTEKVIDFYFANINETNSSESKRAFYNAVSDLGFKCPQTWFSRFYSRYNRVFQYLFARIPNSFNYNCKILQPCHSEDVPFAFGTMVSGKDFEASKQWMRVFSNFAKFGNASWPAYQFRNSDNQRSAYFVFTGDLKSDKIDYNYREKECKFLNSISFDFNFSLISRENHSSSRVIADQILFASIIISLFLYKFSINL